MLVAVIGTRLDGAIRSGPATGTAAGAIVAESSARAIMQTLALGTIISVPTRLADASNTVEAVAVVGALIGAHTGGAVITNPPVVACALALGARAPS
jgi:hypothetical protein